MSDTKSAENAQVMHSIGQLTGAVQAMAQNMQSMHQSITTRMDDIKQDIRRLEAAQSDRMDRIENSLGQRIESLESNVGKRIDGLGTRVANLEAEDKRLIEKTAKLGALGGGVGGALAAAAVEIIKRM
ncbi:hypothetical protein [Oryzomicrobium sp.]|uniref:hypothetical protein n=1 Tax=Oryzomicrobium sp. TaxID=1911578 RepID=UPI002FE167EA